MSMFFSSRKTVFEKLARHLLDSKLSIELPKLFLIAISTTPRHLVDQSSIISCFWCFSSSTASQHLICRCCFFSTPARQMSRHHLDTSFVKNYWWYINSPRAICGSLLSISLSILQTFHLPNLSHSLQTSSLGILKLSSSFPSLGKLLISFIYMHFMF